MIRGTKSLANCFAGTPSRWTILGNQRPVSIKTRTMAVRETSFGSALTELSRKDSIGTGTEHLISTRLSPQDYVLATVEGPGLPLDGVVYFKYNNVFLYTPTSLKEIQKQATNALTNNNLTWLGAVINTVKDTFMYNMNDLAVKKISDAFYDHVQNAYTYRFYKRYHDTFPSLTLVDTLPKRPYLTTELSHSYFPTISVNKDNLVKALQLLEPVQFNWQLPLDTRSVPMVPESSFFMRLNRVDPKKWPNCTQRIDQYNEYALSYTTYPFSSPIRTDDILVPEPFPAPGLLTNRGFSRLIARDSLNRPIESRIGVDFSR